MTRVQFNYNREPYKTIIDVLKEVSKELDFKQLLNILLEKPGFQCKYKPDLKNPHIIYKVKEKKVEKLVENKSVEMTIEEFKQIINTKLSVKRLPLKNLSDGLPMKTNQLKNILIDLKKHEIIESNKMGYRFSEYQVEKLWKEVPNIRKFSLKMIERYRNVWIIGKTLHKNSELIEEIIKKSIEIKKKKDTIENEIQEEHLIIVVKLEGPKENIKNWKKELGYKSYPTQES